MLIWKLIERFLVCSRLEFFQNGGGGASRTDIGDNVTNSIMLDAASANGLSKTFSAQTSNIKWTMSFWIKFAGTSDPISIYRACGGAAADAYIGITNGNILFGSYQGAGTDYSVKTSGLSRSFSGWAHATIQYDSANAVAADRAIIFVNGIRQAVINGANGTFPQNYTLTLNNSGYAQAIGFRPYYNDSFTNEYLADFIFLDGQQVAPTAFGRTSADTGQWVPKSYTGSFSGANSCHLEFKNSSALGTDTSGNGNTWTQVNLSASNQYTDSPTRNAFTLNPICETTKPIISRGNLRFSGWGAAGQCYRAYGTIAPTSGKYCFGLLIGVMSNVWAVGISLTPRTNNVALGSQSDEYALYGNGPSIYKGNGGLTLLGSDSAAGNSYMVAVDIDAGKIWLGKIASGVLTWYGSGNPSTGANPTYTFTAGSKCYITYDTYQTFDGGTVINFAGPIPSGWSMPTGFSALDTVSLPAPAILKPKKHFDVRTRAGTGASVSISDLLFSPDLYWGKSRSNSYYHKIVDRVRGANKPISSNAVNAESTETQGLMSFDAAGYTLGTSSDSTINNSGGGQTYVDWLWKMGGAPVTNTAGTISAQVSANVLAGQSIVLYPCGSSSGVIDTVGHGLSKAPELVIAKNCDLADNWDVGCARLPNPVRAAVYLNLTNPNTAYGLDLRSFSSTTVGLLQNHMATTGGQRLALYCFHSVDGYSLVGSYLGNGSADGTYVNCGFKPAFVMIKGIDETGNWTMFDGKRDPTNPVSNVLYPNLSNAEGSTAFLDVDPFGFKLRYAGLPNTAGVTYMFYAVAECSGKFSTSR